MAPVVVIPLKGFGTAKGRLAAHLDGDSRSRLSELVAAHVVAEAARLDVEVVVVTGDPGVAAWASNRGATVLDEPPPGGLDAAAGAGSAHALRRGEPWVIVHGDLPLVQAGHLEDAVAWASAGSAVLAPSRAGGTNLLAAAVPIAFSYGIGSFARHLAATAHLPQRIVVTTATLLDLDTPQELAAAASRPGGAWLSEFLV